MGRHPKNWQPPTEGQKETISTDPSENQEQEQTTKTSFNNMEQEQQQEQTEPNERELNALVSDIFESYGRFDKMAESVLYAEKRLAEVSTRCGLMNYKFEQAKREATEKENKNAKDIAALKANIAELRTNVDSISRGFARLEELIKHR